MDWKEFSLGLLLNWKTLLPLVGMLSTVTTFTSYQWINAEEETEQFKNAYEFASQETTIHVIELPEKPQILQVRDCNCEKELSLIRSKIERYHPE